MKKNRHQAILFSCILALAFTGTASAGSTCSTSSWTKMDDGRFLMFCYEITLKNGLQATEETCNSQDVKAAVAKNETYSPQACPANGSTVNSIYGQGNYTVNWDAGTLQCFPKTGTVESFKVVHTGNWDNPSWASSSWQSEHNCR